VPRERARHGSIALGSSRRDPAGTSAEILVFALRLEAVATALVASSGIKSDEMAAYRKTERSAQLCRLWGMKSRS
jgi:hypothetical protein